MVEAVWRKFEEHDVHDGNIRDLGNQISSESGMKAVSAMIYLAVLSNLISGKQNGVKQGMKFIDFEPIPVGPLPAM
jgi:hypothetical protein